MNDASTKDSEPPSAAAVVVSAKGDVLLSVTFVGRTAARPSKAATKRPLPSATRRVSSSAPASAQPASAPSGPLRHVYRVELKLMKLYSAYFANLLGNSNFREAKDIAACHADLASRGVLPGDAPEAELPSVPIVDDDDAITSADRAVAFTDLLYLLHDRKPLHAVNTPVINNTAGGASSTSSAGTAPAKVTLGHIATIAVLTNRYDCDSAILTRYLNELKFKWPQTNAPGMSGAPTNAMHSLSLNGGSKKSGGSGGGSGGGDDSESGRCIPIETERLLRQKILVAWWLEQPIRLKAATRELIIRGSSRWTPAPVNLADQTAAWWYLPDGLEEELQHRRECILNTIASVQRHFLALYSASGSPPSTTTPGASLPAQARQQCKLGYDTSFACDAFQLGQMLKFLTRKRLVYLLDFGPSAYDALPEAARLDLDELLSLLRQCPAYQLDRNHINCGLRVRIGPILDYLQTMLQAATVSVSLVGWTKNRARESWLGLLSEDGAEVGRRRKPMAFDVSSGPQIDDDVETSHTHRFEFSQSLASDSRLREPGAMGVDRLARSLFTAQEWDWTPDQGSERGSNGPLIKSSHLDRVARYYR